MNQEMVLFIGRRTLEVALMVSAPALLVALVVGFLTAMMQAITSIRDMTLGMVLKIAAVAVTLLLSGGWIMQVSRHFTLSIFEQMQMLTR